MSKSATDTLHDIINAAVVDAIVALKDVSRGLPNALLRDLNAIHANTAFGDLPEAVQTVVTASVRHAFVTLKKEGYVVADAKSVQGPFRPSSGSVTSGTRDAQRPATPKPGSPRRPRPQR